MKLVSLTETLTLGEVIGLLDDDQQEEVLLTRNGTAVALLVPFDDEDAEWYARERDPAFLESIAHARRQVQEGKTISHTELKRNLGIE